MSDGGSMPGWYPDPAGAGGLRWWDGRTWTGWTLPGSAPAGSAGPPPAGSVRAAVDGEGRVLPWLRASAFGWALLTIAAAATNVAAAPYFRQTYDWLRTTLRHAGTPGYVAPPPPHGQPYGYVGLLALLGMIGVAVWLHRAASTARALGYPSRISPGLGAWSLFIPIVGLWMPAQCLMGCLPPTHRLRGRVPWFWALYVLTGLATLTATVVGAFSRTAGFVCLVPVAAAYLVLLGALLAYATAVWADHRAAVPAGVG